VNADEQQRGKRRQPNSRYCAIRLATAADNGNPDELGFSAQMPHHVPVHRFADNEDHWGKREEHEAHDQLNSHMANKS
jgi:hypothetical protein